MLKKTGITTKLIAISDTMTEHSKATTISPTLPSVCIVMSTYNSAKYVEAQINSILQQEGVDINLWIRDDGSTDETVTLILNAYEGESRIHIECGENLGAAKSFMTAMHSCSLICDYYGFSDADDVWFPNKLTHAINLLKSQQASNIAAVATRLQVVDEKLNHLGYTAIPQRGLSFQNALTQTSVSGNSITMNKTAFDELRSTRPEFIVMHDAWLYLVITALGTLLYTDTPSLLYRQHANNVYGTNHSLSRRISLRVARLLNPTHAYYRQACEFSRLYGDRLSARNKHDIERYLNYRSSFLQRIRFATNPSTVKQRAMSNLFSVFLVLLGIE